MGVKKASPIERVYLTAGCSSFKHFPELPALSDVYTFTRMAKKTFVDGRQQSYERLDPTKQELLDWLKKSVDDWSHRAAKDAVAILFFSTHGFRSQNQTYLAWKDTNRKKPSTLLSTSELQSVMSPWFEGYPDRCAVLILQTCQSPLPIQNDQNTNIGKWWILSAVEQGVEEGWEERSTRDNEDFSASGRLTRRIRFLWEKLDSPMPFDEFAKRLSAIYQAERLPPPPLLSLGEPPQVHWLSPHLPTKPPTVFEGHLFEAFGEKEERKFYGRDHALRAILGVRFDRDFPRNGWLYEEERTLFYGPSGAGKTSLICAGVIPWLRKTHQYEALKEHTQKHPEQDQSTHQKHAADSAQRAVRYVDLSIENIPHPDSLKDTSFLFLDQSEGKITDADFPKFKECIQACDKQKIRVVVLLREDFVGEWERLWRETPWSFVHRVLTPLTKIEAKEVLYNTMPPLLNHDEKEQLLDEVSKASAKMLSKSITGMLSPLLLQIAMKDAWSQRQNVEGQRVRPLKISWKELWQHTLESSKEKNDALWAVLSLFCPVGFVGTKQSSRRRLLSKSDLTQCLTLKGLQPNEILQSCQTLVNEHWIKELKDSYTLNHDVLIPFFTEALEENDEERQRRRLLRKLYDYLSLVNYQKEKENLSDHFSYKEIKEIKEHFDFWMMWLLLEDDSFSFSKEKLAENIDKFLLESSEKESIVSIRKNLFEDLLSKDPEKRTHALGYFFVEIEKRSSLSDAERAALIENLGHKDSNIRNDASLLLLQLEPSSFSQDDKNQIIRLSLPYKEAREVFNYLFRGSKEKPEVESKKEPTKANKMKTKKEKIHRRGEVYEIENNNSSKKKNEYKKDVEEKEQINIFLCFLVLFLLLFFISDCITFCVKVFCRVKRRQPKGFEANKHRGRGIRCICEKEKSGHFY